FARGSLCRRDDGALDPHGLSRAPLVRGALGDHVDLRARVLRMDLSVRNAAPLLWMAPPLEERSGSRARRSEQDARLSAREILFAVCVPDRGRWWKRDRWNVRSDLRCGSLDRPRRDPGRAVFGGARAL